MRCEDNINWTACECVIHHHASVCKSYAMDVPYKEILQQAYLIALSAKESWDPELSKLQTWMDRQLKGRLMKSLRGSQSIEYVEEATASYSFDPARIIEFKDMLMSLSPDAHAIVELVLKDNLPKEIGVDTNASPRKIRGRLSAYLNEKGMAWNRIWSAFRELRTLCA